MNGLKKWKTYVCNKEVTSEKDLEDLYMSQFSPSDFSPLIMSMTSHHRGNTVLSNKTFMTPHNRARPP